MKIPRTSKQQVIPLKNTSEHEDKQNANSFSTPNKTSQMNFVSDFRYSGGDQGGMQPSKGYYYQEALNCS